MFDIVKNRDCGTDFDIGGGTQSNLSSFVDPPEPAQKVMSKDATYAVTTGGEFIAYEPRTDVSEHGVSLSAYLAWYDSEAYEFTAFDFFETYSNLSVVARIDSHEICPK